MNTNIDNIVIIPSALSPTMGVFTPEERLEQTKRTCLTVRTFIPNSLIIINDISLLPNPELKIELSKLADTFIDSDKNEESLYYSQRKLKSPGELILFSTALEYIKNNIDTKNIKRIFKLGARCYLRESFNINDHELAEKQYAFKPVTSWMNDNTKLYITRFWSMDPILIDDYLYAKKSLFNCFARGYDTEHAHYICFKHNSRELSTLHSSCRVAPNGILHED